MEIEDLEVGKRYRFLTDGMEPVLVFLMSDTEPFEVRMPDGHTQMAMADELEEL